MDSPVASKPPLYKTLVVGRILAAAAANPPITNNSCEFGSTKYFLLCGLCGILACGTTHTFVVPLDVIKCRIQTNSEKYPDFFKGFKVRSTGSSYHTPLNYAIPAPHFR